MSTKNNASEDHGLFTDKLKDPDPVREASEKPKEKPKTEATPIANASEPKPVPAVNEPKEKVLVVDDSPTILTVVTGILKKTGFSTIAHRDPNEAMAAIKKMKPDELQNLKAIFSDMVMPNMTGLELLKEVREYAPTKSIPFVMITTEADRVHIQKAALLRVSGYLLKPVTTDTMIELIGNLFPDRADIMLRKSAKAK